MIQGKQLRDCFISAAHAITNNRTSVDELNVFPVPDGDTGTNMSMTFQNALPELLALPDTCTVESVASVTASALLRGARGNSGVILSLLFRGFGRAMVGKVEADSEDFAKALTRGVEFAYRAVMKPTEGTILTVARIAAATATEKANELNPIELWELVLKTAEETLATTPEILPILKKAGVVDAGGKGLCVIDAAILETLRTGVIIPLDDADDSVQPGSTDENAELVREYSMNFIVVKNETASYPKLRSFLESLGNSVSCSEEKDHIRCSLYTEQPLRALGEAIKHGRLGKVSIENRADLYIEEQKEAEKNKQKSNDEFPYVENTGEVEYGIVSVGAGDGIREIFMNLGATRIVNGGQTMNPSTEDIINAVQSISAKNILILANNKNIILSAQQATGICDRISHVVPTRSIPEGIAALMAFDETTTVEKNLENMQQAINGVATGEITFASRNSEFDGHQIKENEILALIGGKLAFTGAEVNDTAEQLIEQLATDDKNFVTIIYGEATDAKQAEELGNAVRGKISSDIEVQVLYGGMPVYYYCISVE